MYTRYLQIIIAIITKFFKNYFFQVPASYCQVHFLFLPLSIFFVYFFRSFGTPPITQKIKQFDIVCAKGQMAIKLIVCFFILLFFQVTETMLLGRTSIRNNLLNNFTHPLRQHVLKRGLPQRKTQMSSRWAFTLIGNISSSFWDYTGKL